MSPVRPEDRDEIIARINRKYEGDLKRGNEYETITGISTGSPELDAAMGGMGVPRGRWTRFYGGYHCLAPGTLILKADFQWVPIETLEAGDLIVGFDENAPGGTGRQRQFREATVTDNPLKVLPSRRITVDQGEEVVASSEHLWLTTTARTDGKRGQTVWKRTDDLVLGDRILWFAKPWSELQSAEDREAAAYLGGLFDGEGTVHKGRVHLYQNEGMVLEKAQQHLEQLDFNTLMYDNKDCKRVSVEATVAGTMKFFSRVPTARLSNGAGHWWQGREIIPKGRYRDIGSSYATVVANEDVGECEVYAIGTSTQTLMANGMFSHNSCKTLTSLNVIREAQKMGLTCAYYNIEKQYDADFAEEKIGIDTAHLDIVEGTTIEEIGEKMEALFGVVHLHVIDSCSIAVSEDELDADIRDWRPGITARAWGKVFRRLNERFDHTDNTVILLDQVRVNFKTGGEDAPGGRILDHQSSMTVKFKRGSWLYRNEDGFLDEKAKIQKGSSGQAEPSGMEIRARVEKSRVSRPLRTASMRLDLDKLEFDRVFEITKMAKHYKVVDQKGPYFYYTPPGAKEPLRFQGEKQLREFARGDVTFQEQVNETVMAIIRR